MAFDNNINYAAVFNRILDEKFYIMPRTSWMENTTPGIVWNGGKYIEIPMMDMDGLGTMQGYKAPDGDLTLEYETKELEYYRGRNFAIGRYEMDLTNMALTAENALKVFLAQHVTPEVDKIRISRLAQAANNYGGTCVNATKTSSITNENILGLLLDDIATVQDQIGESEQLYIQISTTLKNVLQQSTQITRYLNVKDFQIKSATMRLEAINDQYLIGTPSSYMKAAFTMNDGRTTGQTVGGLTFNNLAPGINWIIAARPVADAISRPQVTKVISPDINQEGEFWKIMFSIYHGVWTMDNKAPGLLVNMDDTLGTMQVTSEAGPASGQTQITVNATPNRDSVLMWKAQASTPPEVTFGTALTGTNGWAVLPANGVITATNGQMIAVALCGATSGLPLSSGSATIVANQG